jgi:hypothetical protein
LTVRPAPASSTTKGFSHDPQLNKMSAIANQREDYPSGLVMATIKASVVECAV